MAARLVASITLLSLAGVVSLLAADLREETRRAYDAYATRATTAFIQRSSAPANATAAAEPSVSPGAQDGIIEVTGGLVHHWSGTSFIRGATLEDALVASRAYSDYPQMYQSIVAAQLLEHDGNRYRIRFRVRESAMGRTVVLQVTSRIEYTFPRDGIVDSVANAEEIREVVDAGSPRERYLPSGRDSGYLWRAATLTSLRASDSGVAVAMETIGLSRGFPPMLGWIIEPIARRLGRKSVEQSLQEFHDAVLVRGRGK